MATPDAPKEGNTSPDAQHKRVAVLKTPFDRSGAAWPVQVYRRSPGGGAAG